MRTTTKIVMKASLLVFIFLIVNMNAKADGFWDSLWKAIKSIPLFDHVWGSYTVSGQNSNAPLALFKRTTFQRDKDEIIL